MREHSQTGMLNAKIHICNIVGWNAKWSAITYQYFILTY